MSFTHLLSDPLPQTLCCSRSLLHPTGLSPIPQHSLTCIGASGSYAVISCCHLAAGALTTFLCLHYSCFRQIFLRRGRRCK